MNEQMDIEFLIVKYVNGNIHDDERRELMAWMAQSKENELAFNQMREILLVSRLNDENFRFDAKAAFERVMRKTRKSAGRHLALSYRWAAAVAVFLVMCGALLSYWIRQPEENPVAQAVFQEIIVPLGSRAKMVLPDGSLVDLNAGSTLRYPTDFGRERRDLWIDGEGFFEVRKSSTPFIVHSGTVQIKAVGTSFNVRAYSSEKIVETTLVSGKIEVTDTGNQEKTVEERTLLPGQKLIIGESPEVASRIDVKNNEPVDLSHDGMIFKERVDPEPDISWKDNKWVIDRESLGSLALKLERRFDIEIVFKDEHLKSFRYNGSLPDFSLEQVLTVMSMAQPFHFSINGKTVTFSENKKYKNRPVE